jgi:hypothetical protein
MLYLLTTIDGHTSIVVPYRTAADTRHFKFGACLSIWITSQIFVSLARYHHRDPFAADTAPVSALQPPFRDSFDAATVLGPRPTRPLWGALRTAVHQAAGSFTSTSTWATISDHRLPSASAPLRPLRRRHRPLGSTTVAVDLLPGRWASVSPDPPPHRR